LPKPVGILASHDRPGRDLAETCVQLGLRVPDEVAILGVDDDEFECKLSHPPLSSIRNPGVQIGYDSAQLLDQLMSGQKPETVRMYIPPSYVAARRSTETTALADPDVAAALIWIREHLSQDISVDDVAEVTGTSRRTLERRFGSALGSSILGEIQRMRIERAKHLLAETDLKLSVIAQQCGIRSGARFAVVFKRMTGHRPSVFRCLAGGRIVDQAAAEAEERLLT
jgi:LacI family transcriptional regulator